MHPAASTLADEFARVRMDVAAERAPFWMPLALHAMIIAALVRLFESLEAMIRLWQEGRLPTPEPRPARQPRQGPGHALPKQPRPRHGTARKPRARSHPSSQAASPRTAAPRPRYGAPSPGRAPMRAPARPIPSVARAPPKRKFPPT
jgi:hypothetical protein